MNRNITIELTKATTAWPGARGYDDKMGARPLGRVIQEHIKKPLAQEPQFGKLAKDDVVRVGVKTGGWDPKYRRSGKAPHLRRQTTIVNRKMIRSALTGLALLYAATSVAAQDIVLTAPIDCSLDDDCYIQQYVDHTDGKGASDFRCSNLSYDQHKGTDFALRTLSQMRAGVNVLAAAPGKIKAVRSGVEDALYPTSNADNISGRECGNGVVIQHAGGWETQYCHMEKGSVKVKWGQVVSAGAVLGQVGLSGRTQFPHVHLSVRKDGKVVDPFEPDGKITCGAPETDMLWEKPPPYRPGGVLYAAFSDRIPTFSEVKSGRAALSQLPVEAPAIVVFGFGFGAQKGDQMRLVLKGPTGVMLDKSVNVEKDQTQLFKAVGKRLTQSAWPKGTYSGTVSLLRNGRVINTERTKIPVR